MKPERESIDSFDTLGISTNLSKRIAEDAKLIAELKREVSTQRHGAHLAEGNLDKVKCSLESCNRNAAELSRRNVSLVQGVNDRSTEVFNLKKSEENSSQIIADLTQKSDLLHQRIYELEQELDSSKYKDANIIGLNNQIQNLSSSMSIITKDNTNLESKLKASEEHNTRLASRVSELSAQSLNRPQGITNDMATSDIVRMYQRENLSLKTKVRDLKEKIPKLTEITEPLTASKDCSPRVIVAPSKPISNVGWSPRLEQHIYVNGTWLAIIKNYQPMKVGEVLRLNGDYDELYQIIHESVVHCIATGNSYRILKCAVEDTNTSQ